MRRKQFSHPGQPPLQPGTLAQLHLAHLASLRQARVHHKAIALELRNFFDSVAAEAGPSAFLTLIQDDAEEKDG